MKPGANRTIFLVVVLILLAVSGAPRVKQTKLNEKTYQNLSAAMRGEAFAHAKYLLYAEQARKNGKRDLAELFEKTARVEFLEHLEEEAELAGTVRSDADNLRDAIQGESYEVETMYREFSEQAAAVGDLAAERRFEEIRRDEAKHRDAFKAALARVENEKPSGR